jgi:hypothetical protein
MFMQRGPFARAAIRGLSPQRRGIKGFTGNSPTSLTRNQTRPPCHGVGGRGVPTSHEYRQGPDHTQRSRTNPGSSGTGPNGGGA